MTASQEQFPEHSIERSQQRPQEHPWQRADKGVVLRIRVTPKSSRDVIEGIELTAEGTAFKTRLRAIPAGGAANAALVALVAAWLDLPKSAIILNRGGKSRVKLLLISGDPDSLERQLMAKLSAFTTAH